MNHLRIGRGLPDAGGPGGTRMPSTDSLASPRWHSISAADIVPHRRGLAGVRRCSRSISPATTLSSEMDFTGTVSR